MNNSPRLRFLKPFGSFCLSIAILMLIWEIAVFVSGVPEYLLPTPRRVGLALLEMFTDGLLFVHVFGSLRRFVIAYAVSCALGITVGVFFGWFKFAWVLAEPIVLLLKPISPVAWTPFVMLWFGLGDAPAIFTIGIAGFFNMLLATVGAVGNVNSSYMNVAQNFGLTRFQTLHKIALPASFPYIAQGMRSALTTSWIFLVAGELMGATTGLGFFINDARHILRSDLILAGIAIIGTIGFCLEKLLKYLEALAAKKWGLSAENDYPS